MNRLSWNFDLIKLFFKVKNKHSHRHCLTLCYDKELNKIKIPGEAVHNTNFVMRTTNAQNEIYRLFNVLRTPTRRLATRCGQ